MTTMAFDVVLPNWVMFIAHDSGGEWYGYSHYPEQSENDGFWLCVPLGRTELICETLPPEDWTQEIYEITR